MALILCPECGREISSFAEVCVHCGFPISKPCSTPNTSESFSKSTSSSKIMGQYIPRNPEKRGGVSNNRRPRKLTKDIIKELMHIKHLSQSQLASMMGLKSQSNITGLLNRGESMRVNNLVLLVEAIGGELIISDRSIPGGEWIVSVSPDREINIPVDRGPICYRGNQQDRFPEQFGVNGKEAIKQIMTNRGETNASLADKLGVSQQTLWDRLNSKRNRSLTLSLFDQMARVLGYKLIMIPVSTDIPEEAILIEEI